MIAPILVCVVFAALQEPGDTAATAGDPQLLESRAALSGRESFNELMAAARVAMRVGRLNESIEWLEKAARLKPDHPDIYKVLGLDYALGGMQRESEGALRRAAELAPRNWEMRYLHGRALHEIERIAEAREELRAAVELNPKSVRAWTALGQTEERRLAFAEAEQCYRKALALCAGAECAWPLFQLGVWNSRENGAAVAAPYFRKAINERPEWAKPHFHLAKALSSLEDLEAARREAEAAVRLDETRAEHHYLLGQLCRRLGDPGTAGIHLARFRDLRKSEAGSR